MKRHAVFVILDNNKGFINLRFKHKLYWMKTEWDQSPKLFVAQSLLHCIWLTNSLVHYILI